ncbi:MAG TPA: universal stress protein [Sedimenticola sp.]|nr:universal stress protein [Sedimenticola sp.]
MATFKKILISYNGSQPCRRAAEKAMEIAADQGAEVFALKVIAFSYETIAPSDRLWETIMDDLRGKATAILDELKPMAEEKGLNLTTEIREGVAEEEIAGYACEIGADLIVAAVGGRVSRMGRFLGKGQQRMSIRTLVSEAPCPVMLLH